MIINKNAVARRRTRQGDALRRVFETAERPLTPAEACARATPARVGIATAYRAVGRWTAEGWLAEVALPGEPARYERGDLAHHHHFHCDRCTRVYDVRGCPRGIARLVPRGFVARAHQITFHGVCRDCSGAPAAPLAEARGAATGGTRVRRGSARR